MPKLRILYPPDCRKVGLQTNGGMTPVAQAYMNFKDLGPLLVGLFMGYLFSSLYSWSTKYQDSIRFSFYILLAAASVRIYFYELFDFYKMILVFGLLYILIYWGNRLSGMRVNQSSLSSTNHPEPLLSEEM